MDGFGLFSSSCYPGVSISNTTLSLNIDFDISSPAHLHANSPQQFLVLSVISFHTCTLSSYGRK